MSGLDALNGDDPASQQNGPPEGGLSISCSDLEKTDQATKVILPACLDR
jgi:hypothetical protein